MRARGPREGLGAFPGAEVLLSLPPARRAPPAEFLYSLLRQCVDIRAIWSVGHTPSAPQAAVPCVIELLAFADRRTLASLRVCDRLHRADVRLLVVIDGDEYENAWGEPVYGSLSRCAWQEVSSGHAFYDEARWASPADEAGAVVRERREAYLIWRLPERTAAL